MRNDFN